MNNKGEPLNFDLQTQSLIKQLTGANTLLNSTISDVKQADPHRISYYEELMKKIGQVRGRPLYYPYIGSGRGNGPFVELEDGSVKLDFINGIGIHILGHSHPEVIQASLYGALQDVTNQGNLQPNKEYFYMLQKLVELAKKGSKIEHGWLATCGTMANETALKIARQKKTPARMIISFKNAFAGRSTMMAEVTDNPAYRVGLPEYNEVLRLPWYDKKNPTSIEDTLRALKLHVEKHSNNISVFSFEPMLGEGGYMPAPREFFIPLLEFCKSQNIPIWSDEVQTFTRTGQPFAFQTLEIGEYIDIVTVAKTAQIGATLYTSAMNPQPGLIAGTFSGSSSALNAGLAILNFLDNNHFYGPEGRVSEIHNYFISGLNKLAQTSCKNLISDATGMGLMIAFTPKDGKKETVEALLKTFFSKGLIAFSCGKEPVRIRFLIPAIVTNQQLDLALKIIEESLLKE